MWLCNASGPLDVPLIIYFQIVLISGKSSGAKETKDDKSLDDYGYGHHGHAHGHRHGGKYYRGRYAGQY